MALKSGVWWRRGGSNHLSKSAAAAMAIIMATAAWQYRRNQPSAANATSIKRNEATATRGTTLGVIKQSQHRKSASAACIACAQIKHDIGGIVSKA